MALDEDPIPLSRCSIAYLVSETTVRQRLAPVLDKLEAISEAEAHGKLQTLSDVRDAFVCRSPGTGSSSSSSSSGSSSSGSSLDVRLTAPDYLLGVACDAARQAKTGSKPSMPIAEVTIRDVSFDENAQGLHIDCIFICV